MLPSAEVTCTVIFVRPRLSATSGPSVDPLILMTHLGSATEAVIFKFVVWHGKSAAKQQFSDKKTQ